MRKWLTRGLLAFILGIIYNCVFYGNCGLFENTRQVLLLTVPPSSGFSIHGVASFGLLGYWCISYAIFGFLFSRPFITKRIPNNFFSQKTKTES
jgi:hypothetical protein